MTSRKTVLATGVFDILHLGHIRFLRESRKKGGPRAKLVVVIARDKTVLKRKGRPPIMPEGQRRQMVASLKYVDKAVLGHAKLDMLGVLREEKPDIVSVGYDQRGIKASLEKLIRKEKLPLRVVQIGRFGQGTYSSSSQLKDKIGKEWRSRN
jgi:FAD synthetase